MTTYKYFGELCGLADKANLHYRNTASRFNKTWGRENVQWALRHCFIKESDAKVHLGECRFNIYYEFTKLGEMVFRFNLYSIKDWFRYVIYKIRK